MKELIQKYFKFLVILVILLVSLISLLLIFFLAGIGIYFFVMLGVLVFFLFFFFWKEVLFLKFTWFFVAFYCVVSFGITLSSVLTKSSSSSSQSYSSCRWNTNTATQTISGYKTYLTFTKLKNWSLEDIKKSENNISSLSLSISSMKNKTAEYDLGTRIENSNPNQHLVPVDFEYQVCDSNNNLIGGSYRSSDSSKLTFSGTDSIALETGMRYNIPSKAGTYRVDVSYFVNGKWILTDRKTGVVVGE